MDFNIVVTYETGSENLRWAFAQITECIGNIYTVHRVGPSMIIMKVSDPYGVWFNLKRCLYGKDTPIHRVIPVDEVVEPLVDRVALKAKDYALARIPADATYRVTLHGKLFRTDERGRLIKVPSDEAIKAIAAYIDRKVNLRNPDWVVYVRTIAVRRWRLATVLGVAKAIVFKNIRVGPPTPPL